MNYLALALFFLADAGLAIFFKGFLTYRKYHVLTDIPEAPIRSIAMGLVEIHGKAQGDQMLQSPVSKTPCFLRKIDVRVEWKCADGDSSVHKASETEAVPFYCEDETGRVLVDPGNAELDLIATFNKSFGKYSGSLLQRMFGEGDEMLTTSRGPLEHAAATFADALIVKKGRCFSSSPVVQSRYTVAEYCILPGHWYHVTGTCTLNPEPRDENDRNLIVKGVNDPIFLLSWRRKQQLEQKLWSRALGYVWGGAALTMVSAFFLLAQLGWL